MLVLQCGAKVGKKQPGTIWVYTSLPVVNWEIVVEPQVVGSSPHKAWRQQVMASWKSASENGIKASKSPPQACPWPPWASRLRSGVLLKAATCPWIVMPDSTEVNPCIKCHRKLTKTKMCMVSSNISMELGWKWQFDRPKGQFILKGEHSLF